ncbi:MAG: flavin-containing monooxygenase [Sandaracinaceae bacterium]
MEHVNVLIVGAGVSGIGAACHLRRECPEHTFTILEARADLGGTWDLFRYPGIRSDSDMYTFGYAFKPWAADRDIATGDAILGYLDETVREHGLRDAIRFGHRVETLSWSSRDARWVARVTRLEDGASLDISCDFLVTCTGYYDYEHGYLPPFEGLERYRGVVAHPQHWPEDLDYTGKRVLVIGSGATAVTLVPAMAGTAAHVTMLQRSPTYMFSRPWEDAVALWLRERLPARLAHALIRWKNIGFQLGSYAWTRVAPGRARKMLRDMAVEGLGPDIDVDVHFNPSYDPWDQRLCLIPDGDLYRALRTGAATVVTDTIDHFTETGVALASGATIDADVVVPATGLELKFLSNIAMDVDGAPVEPGSLVTYRGVMFANVPNWAAVVGYTSASWTLKADLVSGFVCRLLRRMRDKGYDTVVPVLDGPPATTLPFMTNLTSGYIQRGAQRMPKQGDRSPWTNPDNYLRDLLSLRWRRLDDGILRFGRVTRGGEATEDASEGPAPRVVAA